MHVPKVNGGLGTNPSREIIVRFGKHCLVTRLGESIETKLRDKCRKKETRRVLGRRRSLQQIDRKMSVNYGRHSRVTQIFESRDCILRIME